MVLRQALIIRNMAFLLVGAVVALVGIYSYLTESTDLSGSIANGIAPLCPLLVALVGLYCFGREGLVRDDMLHTMGLMLSIGMFVMTLPESALTVISQTQSPTDFHLFYFTVALLQIPGILMWTIGITGYLIIFNRTVSAVAPRQLILLLTSLSVVVVGVVKVATVFTVTQRSIVEFLACTPTSVCIAFMVGSLLFLLWYFRSGTLAIPMVFLLLSMVLLLAHGLLWCTFISGPLDVLSRILSIESYLMMGVSLSFMGGLDSL